MNKKFLIRKARTLELEAKIKCVHGRSKLWCVGCRREHIETASQDSFVKLNSYKRMNKILKKNPSAQLKLPEKKDPPKGALFE